MSFDDFDRDAPQEIDLVDDDDVTIKCPGCGRWIDEDAPRCPYCGDWVILGMSPAEERVHGWFWPIVVAVLVGVILVMWIGLRW